MSDTIFYISKEFQMYGGINLDDPRIMLLILKRRTAWIIPNSLGDQNSSIYLRAIQYV